MCARRSYYPESSGMTVKSREGLISRREAIERGAIGAASLMLAERLCFGAPSAPAPVEASAKSAAGAGTAKPAKAKAVIQIWLSGGPPHTDTFDPKPDAGSEYTGPLTGTVETNVKGIRVGDKIPELAKVADKYSIIRSMTHGNNGHETAAYMVQTGRMAGSRHAYPAVGAVVTAFKGFQEGDQSLIPPYIVLTQPQGRFSEAGFLGIRYKPFATGGDPNAQKFAVEGIVDPSMTEEQQQQRREMLNRLNTLGHFVKNNPELDAARAAKEQAYDLILGDAGKVFDLNEEKPELRERYGRNTFGQSCLAARRLIEQGVKYVTINQFVWDTHKDHFPSMQKLLPNFDNGVATLLSDLADHGLLDTTIVWIGGEFGRTPKVDWSSPWNGGRHHYGPVFSHVVAGGGFKGGQVVGSSDAKGEQVKDRPVYPWDLIGTMYELLGIDPDGSLPHPMNEEIRATPAPEEGYKTGGRVKELV